MGRTEKIQKLFTVIANLSTVEECQELFDDLCTYKEVEKMAERLYAGSYTPENDALARLVERLVNEKDAALLPELRALVLRQPRRLRGWLELARLQQELQHDAAASVATLEEAATAVREPEDAAMLLYRAGTLCESALQNPARAREIWQRAADVYPATVYGAKAAVRLD